MKILYVSTCVSEKKYNYLFNLYKNNIRPSIQKFHYSLLNGLNNNECDVTALCGYQIPVNTGKKIWFCNKEIENNIVFKYPFILNFSFLRSLMTIISFIFYLIFWSIRNIRDEKRIIIDSSYISVTPIIVFLAKIFGISVTAIVADIYTYMSNDIQITKKRSIIEKVSCYLANYCWNNYDNYILLTEEMNKIVNKRNVPYIVMEGLVNQDIKFAKKVKKKNAIMYAGGLHEKYGVKLLIDAFIKLNPSKYELWLCGSGDVEEYIKLLNNNKIRYFGVLSNDEVFKLEQEATLLVNPRFTNEEYTKYSFPSKTLEYMSSGTPVLTTRLSGIPGEYDKYLYYFDSNDVDGFANKIDSIIKKDSQSLKTFGNKAKSYVLNNKNNYSQAKRIKRMISSSKTSSKTKIINWISSLSLIVSLLFIIIGTVKSNVEINIISLSLLFLGILIKALSNYKNNLIFLLFLISFFTFGMGQYYFPNVTNDSLYYQNFNSVYVSKTIFIQYIALLFTCFGYYVVASHNAHSLAINNNIRNKYRKFSKYIFAIFLVTSFISIICNAELAYYTFKYGYLYIMREDFVAGIPEIFIKIGSFNFLFLTMLLSTSLNKKQIIISMAIYLINSIVCLFSGSRFNFIVSLFVIIFVIVYFITSLSSFHKYVKKIEILLYSCLVLMPVLIVSMSLFNSIRNKIPVSDIDPLKEFKAFFVSQGRSANLITYSQMYEEELQSVRENYIMGIYYDNSIKPKVCLIYGELCDKPVDKSKYYFGYAISKIVLCQKLVSAGHGLGSQYLCDLYLEGGMPLIVTFSFAFGFMMSLLFTKSKNSIIASIFMYNFLPPILRVSRGVAFELISPFLSNSIWCMIIIFIIYKKGIDRKNENIMVS